MSDKPCRFCGNREGGGCSDCIESDLRATIALLREELEGSEVQVSYQKAAARAFKDEHDSLAADLAALRARVEEARQRFLEIAVDHGHLIDWGLGAELDEGLAILAPPEGPQ